MGKKQATEHSPLLGDSAISLHDAADAPPVRHHRDRRGGRLAHTVAWITGRAQWYKREIIWAAVAAAVVAALLAFALFHGGTTSSPVVVGTIDEEEVRSLAVLASICVWRLSCNTY